MCLVTARQHQLKHLPLARLGVVYTPKHTTVSTRTQYCAACSCNPFPFIQDELKLVCTGPSQVLVKQKEVNNHFHCSVSNFYVALRHWPCLSSPLVLTANDHLHGCATPGHLDLGVHLLVTPREVHITDQWFRSCYKRVWIQHQVPLVQER